jgi:invasion protein IalB
MTLAACALLAGPAFSQQSDGSTPPPAVQKSAQPVLMKTFNGWQVRCYNVATPAPCDMWEAVAFKESGQLAVSVSVTYAPSRDQHLIQIIVPLRVDFTKGAVLSSDTFTANPWKFNHCDRIGCYISVLADSRLIDALGHATNAKVTVVPYGDKAIALAFPLNGFTEAHSSMVELARSKTGGSSSAKPGTPDAPH